MGRTQQQTTIPGTASEQERILENLPPDVRQAIDDGLDHWLDMKAKQRDASAGTKTAHASLVTLVTDQRIERWPYIDPITGKKKHLIIKRDPKAATMNAPRRERFDREQPGEEVEPKTPTEERAEKAKKREEAEASRVEHRKVKRAAAKAELKVVEEEIRAKDDGDNQMTQGAAAVDGALRPAKNYDEEDETDPFAGTRGAMASSGEHEPPAGTEH